MTKEKMEVAKDSEMWNMCGGDLNKVSARTAFDARRAGDKAGAEVVDKYIDYLVCGLVNMINIFQPEVFIIGGGVSNEKQFLLDLLRPLVDAEDFAKDAAKRTRLVTATCGNDAGIIGAAMNSIN